MATRKAQLACPECGQKFDFAKTLGRHRLDAHGVAGKSKSATRARELRALRPPPEPVNLTCECGFKTESKAGLTIHRKAVHNIVSASPTAMAIRASNPLQCPNCEFIAVNKIGLSNHRSRTHGIASKHELEITRRIQRKKRKADLKGLTIEPAETITAVAVSNNGHHPEESHAATDGIPEAALALTLGRFQGLCASIAYELDLPARLFTQRVAEFVYAATVRQSPRSAVRVRDLR